MFEGFELVRVPVRDAARSSRSPWRFRPRGPPVARTPAHAHHLASSRAVLARASPSSAPTCAGTASTTTTDQSDHGQASKRTMAGDIVALMRDLGHERFAVVGHDRGATSRFGRRWTIPTGVRTWPSSTPADRRAPRPARPRPFAERLVALVLLRPAGHAGARDHRRPRGLVRGRPGSERWERRTTPTPSRRSPTRTWCARCSRTTGQG